MYKTDSLLREINVFLLGEELEYEEALPLMAVEFVRNSQYTVLPFPFKYLREYIKQC